MALRFILIGEKIIRNIILQYQNKLLSRCELVINDCTYIYLPIISISFKSESMYVNTLQIAKTKLQSSNKT